MLYILIPGTLIVWGLIIYKIVNNVQSDGPVAAHQNVALLSTDETVNDTFSINPTYRDPFLGKMIQEHGSDDETANNPLPSVPVVKPVTAWPAIVYSGIIKNQKSNKEMVLLEINGQGYTMKVGETVNGVLLFKAFRDSVELHFLREKKFIHK